VLASFAPVTFAETHRIEKVLVQLDTVRDAIKGDFTGTIAKVAVVRYFNHSPNHVRAARQELTERAALPRRLQRAQGHEKPPRSSGTYAPEQHSVCEYRATPRPLSTSRNAKWQSDCGLVTNKEFVHGCERS